MRSVVIVGGGPAGMTAALLLARAGHRVTLAERARELGGLWASQRDADGYFLADNSCKVYQPSYRTTPALLRLVGTDWRSHFVPRHDLTRDWLRPFVRDCTARDLALLAGAFALHRSGAQSLHETSVAEFMDAAGVSEPCRAWMRATALGGIAGTLRMTMWELFHRLGSNLDGVLASTSAPLHWNARPPSAPGGFVSLWTAALERTGVQLLLGRAVRSVAARAGGGVRLATGDGALDGDVALLALPPPALSALFAESGDDVARAFGRSRAELTELLRVSRYEHLGITWHFDRPLPRDLPLGGHTVRSGWHAILVQHEQYGPHLRPPAVTAVVGSVALDTDFRHPRLGTRADAHDPDALARILWEDQRAADPTLPEPIAHHVVGLSAASQIVAAGPLPMHARGLDVILASSVHGEAPYFTASLETAIQSGALAARAVDERVEQLPMARPAALPWGRPRGRALALEVVTALPCSAADAWDVFIDIAGWRRWSRFVLSLAGELSVGARWEVVVRGANGGARSTLRPRLLSLDPPRGLRLATRLGADWLVRIEHAFVFEDAGPGGSVLRQPFEVTGRLSGATWGTVRPSLTRFAEVGTDLARFLEGARPRG